MSEEAIRILYNMVNVTCCTILAIVFHMWPLIFLACLFWIYKKE